MHLTYILRETCSVGCTFCPFRCGDAGTVEEHIARITGLVSAGDGAEQLFLYGGDVLRRPNLPELLEGIGRMARAPDVYLYAPRPSVARLAEIANIGTFKGLTVPLFHPSRRVNRHAPNPTDTLRDLQAAAETLEIVPYFFLLRQTSEILAGYVGDVHRALTFSTAFIRVMNLVDDETVDCRYGPIVEHIAEASRVARELGVDLFFQGDEHPPPCVGNLYRQAPELFSLVMAHRRSGENAAAAACATCDLRGACRWGYRRYLERYGDTELEPVSLGKLPRRHVREYDPSDPESLRRYRWYLNRSDVGVPCAKPWENMEMMGVSEVRSQPCSADWLKRLPPIVSAKNALEQWNGAYYRRLRKEIAHDRQDRACQPHCMLRQRREVRRHEDDLIEVTGVSDRFLDNRLRHYQELMAGAEVMSTEPLYLAIGPTWACNFSCVFCHSVPLREKTGRPELGPEFYDALRLYLPYVHELSVSGPGEPLVSTAFRAFLESTDFEKFPDLRITLTTNGSMLAPKTLERLFRAPFKGFIISLNAGTAEVHQAVSRTGHFEKVRRNLERLLENLSRFRTGPPEVQLSFVLAGKNYRDLPAFLELADRYDRPIIILAMEISQYNTAESVIWQSEDLREVIEIIDTAIERYHRNRVTTQYLNAVRQTLEIQASEAPIRDVGRF